MFDSFSYLRKFQAAVPILACVFLIAPAVAQEQTKFEVPSDQGTFRIEVIWTPNELGRDHTFSLTFIEPETKSELEDIRYDLVVLQGDDQMLRRVDQVSTEQKVRFDEVGPHTIVIEDIEGLGEDASFTIEVTPEFPLGAIIPVVAGTLIAIFAVRSKSLFSQWEKK
jgi:hypothetical protein